MSKKTVKLTLEVPKGIVDFASDLLKFSADDQTVEKFLSQELIGDIRSIIDDLPNTWFDSERLAKKYGLDKP